MSKPTFRVPSLVAVCLGIALVAGALGSAPVPAIAATPAHIAMQNDAPSNPLRTCTPPTDAFVSLESAPEIAPSSPVPVSAGYLRLWDMGVAWRDVEPASGAFNFTTLDQRIAQAEASHAKVLYVIGLTPQWAASDPNAGDPRWGPGSASPPADPSTLVTFVKTLAQRYGNRISAYELWNEADIQTFWTGTGAQLASMLAPVYSTIKQYSPGAIVLAPSTTTRTPGLMKKFVTGFFPAAATTSPAFAFDGFAIHSYPGGNQGVDDRALQITDWQTEMKSAISTAAPADANTVLARPVWDTELNFGLAGPGGTPGQQYSDAQGAQTMKDAYASSLALGIDATFWYMYTKDNFPLLGIQFNAGTPSVNAAWNEIRGKYTPGAQICPTTAQSGAASAVTDGGTQVQVTAPAIQPVTIPDELVPAPSNSTTLVGDQQVACPTGSGSSSVAVNCNGLTQPVCTKSGTSPQHQPRLAPAILIGVLATVAIIGGAVILADNADTPDSNATIPDPPTTSGQVSVTPPQSSLSGAGNANQPNCQVAPRALVRAKPAVPTLVAGGITYLQVAGMAPNTPVTVYLRGNSTPLGRFMSNAAGKLTSWVRIPASTPLANAVLQVNGMFSSNTGVSYNMGFAVRRGQAGIVHTSIGVTPGKAAMSAAASRQLAAVLRKVPPASTCAITRASGTAAGSLAQAKNVASALATRGFTCSIARKPGSAGNRVGLRFAYLG